MKEIISCVLIAFSMLGCVAHTPTDSHRAEFLIEQLASDFPPAHEDLYHGPELAISIFGDQEDEQPDPSRVANYERIWNAKDQLKSLGLNAFPALVNAIDDERYSYSGVYAAWRNHSVGDACFFIIQSQVEYYGYGYKSRQAPSTGSTAPSFTKPSYLYAMRNHGLEAWWEERKYLSLQELQIEALEWTIEQEVSAGFTNPEQKKIILEPLENRLAELRVP
ncbi:hypothetical protein [Algisphaera agarilytica]|uniref:Lipoprotein n=1 Tax=Algisphaera agarilytica TaxID=1385975 RepID=A0A7X0LME9_9BACT|nr:hypothetical protein [Algisphaera agarilytica]MBB6430953.1 hypothetical protein [Algisphaera agarilytica]